MSANARALTRRFVLLTVLRWLPIGLTVPVSVLYALDRGLTLAEFGAAAAAQGVMVLLLELPSGSLADAWGRRPVLLVAGVLQVAALVVLAFASTPWAFAAVYVIMGAFRAFDSGALEAWFADAVLAAGRPDALARGLGAAGSAIGTAIGGGALVSSGLVLLAPELGLDPLLLPIAGAAVLAALSLAGTALLLRESRQDGRARLVTALRGVPAGLRDGIRLVTRSRVLRAVVAVELFWGFGMIAFENLTPVRMGETLGDADAAAGLMGPVTAAAWLLFAVGSWLAERLARRVDVAVVALVLRLLQGATVVGIGLATGPVGVAVAYLACYTVHGGSGPLHNILLHRQVAGRGRATVLSINSMVALPAGSVGSIVLGAIATGASVGTAAVVGGIVLALAAPLYLAARRRDHGGTRDHPPG